MLETGWAQSPPWFVEPQEFHSSISLWYQWNTCRWRFLMKLETQWNSFPSSGRNHSAADKDTLAYTAWPDGLKCITNSVCFLFSKWFITKFCFPIRAFSSISSQAAGCFRVFQVTSGLVSLLSQSVLQLLTLVLWHAVISEAWVNGWNVKNKNKKNYALCRTNLPALDLC